MRVRHTPSLICLYNQRRELSKSSGQRLHPCQEKDKTVALDADSYYSYFLFTPFAAPVALSITPPTTSLALPAA